MNRNSLSQKAKTVYKTACKSISKVLLRHHGAITIPYEDAFEIVIQSPCNGAYPVTLAYIDTSGFYCVEEGAVYEQDYDFNEDEDGILVCLSMDFNEVSPIDVCKVADYLTKRSHYEKRYQQIVDNAETILGMIPEGVFVEVKDCKANCLDRNYDFFYSEIGSVCREYAITQSGTKVDWSHFMPDDLLIVADAVLANSLTTLPPHPQHDGPG